MGAFADECENHEQQRGWQRRAVGRRDRDAVRGFEPVAVGTGRGNVQMLDLLKEWAAERGLDIDEADVQDWQDRVRG